MKPRLRVAALQRILENHHRWEQRTLADLRRYGFRFQSVDRAERYLKAQQTLARMDHDELVELVASRAGREEGKR